MTRMLGRLLRWMLEGVGSESPNGHQPIGRVKPYPPPIRPPADPLLFERRR